MSIVENVQAVQARIAAACVAVGRDPAAVTLVAISKKKPVADIEAAIAAGVQHFGENRVEEAQEKIPSVQADVTWHMVGHIQSRKARLIPPLFNVIHSLDSVKLAGKLASEAGETPLDVLVQVNISGEGTKSGLNAFGWQTDASVRTALWQDFRAILALPGLNVSGLMTMAPIVDEMEQTRPVFAGLAALRDALQADLEHPLPELSMGMTDDYPIAIQEGATLVRIGRAIFGER